MTADDKHRTTNRWLDAGLHHYGQVTPSDGLERRVLANLRTQETTRHSQWFWTPVLAGLIVVASLAIFWPKQATPRVVQTAVFIGQPSQAVTTAPKIAAQTRPTSLRHDAGKSGHNSTVESSPKLDQFPSPRPLSQQEELLLAYVRQVPKEDLNFDLQTDISVKPLAVKNLDIPPLSKLEPGSDN